MKYKICIVTTMSSSIDNWVKPFLDEYSKNGFHVTVVSSMTDDYKEDFIKEYNNTSIKKIDMPRGVNFYKSLKSTILLYKLFNSEKYDLVQYSTPNASLYGSIASFLSKTPVRLYAQWGMVFVSMTGFKRKVFQLIEKLICSLSTEIQPDSKGNFDYAQSIKLYPQEKGTVIWNGSAKGVDLKKFDFSKKTIYNKQIRELHHIKSTDIVLGFVGRLGRDKGCNELFAAFQSLKIEYPSLKLLFVGPIEKEETIEPKLLSWFYTCPDVIITNRIPDVERYMSAMDIFLLPSYREGFGMSVVEAQAMGVPVIVTDIPGPRNGMLNGKTGILIKTRSTNDIIESVSSLLEDRNLIKHMSLNGVEFASNNFDSSIFINKVIKNRKKLIDLTRD